MTPLPRLFRLLSAITLLVFAVWLAVPALEAAAQVGAVAHVNTGRLNVRSGPGVMFSSLTSVPFNTELTLIGRAIQSTWVQVRTPTGVVGWVNSLYVRTFADLSLLPITYNQVITPNPNPNPGVPGGPTIHVVRQGETLQTIARRYGTTWQALAAANNLINPNFIFAGQRLIISFGTTPTIPTQPNPGFHIVQPGETLQIIARRYGTTWPAIAAANNLINPNVIYTGQRLVIPSAPAAPRYHTVQRGETLFSIAQRYGTTVAAIMTANNLLNPNRINAGQQLLIP